MAIDIKARILAAKAGESASSIVDSFTSGFTFKGAVSYVDDLPTSGNTNGDMYLVKYAGSSGTTPLNVRYAWGDDGGTDAWIPLSTAPYVLVFNATSDWTAVSGGGYSITVLESTHGHGANAIGIVWRENNGNYVIPVGTPTDGYTMAENGDGDISIVVDDTGRFAGKIVIL